MTEKVYVIIRKSVFQHSRTFCTVCGAYRSQKAAREAMDALFGSVTSDPERWECTVLAGIRDGRYGDNSYDYRHRHGLDYVGIYAPGCITELTVKSTGLN